MFVWGFFCGGGEVPGGRARLVEGGGDGDANAPPGDTGRAVVLGKGVGDACGDNGWNAVPGKGVVEDKENVGGGVGGRFLAGLCGGS